ncbi:aminotransferase class V-fold PLP-dependent enzyme [Paenibacillus physcomitrellae]|uniref:aminotransferase class V-fold PLP-dependent enzyme n=1 Tax=Paenibacillus physcomitrellae TaxID=1619311 RepID=UPI003570BD10
MYLDHAATSWPKPEAVINAMTESVTFMAGSPGRGTHGMSLQAGRTMNKARSTLSKLLGFGNPNDVAFAQNATMALNLAIKGLLQPGDHVISTMLEHNSVRRPLEFLKRTQGIEVNYVPVDLSGQINLEAVKKLFRTNTKLVIATHSSNLLGCILPVEELARLAHEHGAVMLVDGAQTVGNLPVDVERMGIDMLAFPGHKGLLGPQGTGGLYIHPDINLEPQMHGGTGSQSAEPEQPDIRPDRYEAGTPNIPGISGLAAGAEEVLRIGVEQIYKHEWSLTQTIVENLQNLSGVKLIGPALGEPRTGIVSFILENQDPAQTAFHLDRKYGIAVRAGYHCTPLGHAQAQTTETGAVRVSVGYTTQEYEVETLIRAVAELSKG